MRSNRLPEAQSLCEQVAHDENNAGAWSLLAVIHGMQENLHEAVRCCHHATALNPDDAESYANLGNALSGLGHADDAIAAYRRHLALRPDNAEAHRRLGMELAKSGQPAEAAACCRRAIEIDPKNASLHFDLGNVLRDLHDYDAAAANYRRALALEPAHLPARCHLGITLVDQKEFEAALIPLREVLDRTPDDARARYYLGYALECLGQLDEAIVCYRRAITVKPDYAEAYNSLGHALQSGPGALDEAIKQYRQAVTLNPDFAEAWNNLGVAVAIRSPEAAVEHYRQAIALRPDFAEAHFNLSLVQLLTGDLSAGWKGYEWRWKCGDKHPRAFPQPPWDGADLAGRTILLHAEQGFGDTLQFIRYAALVKRRGGRVILECQPELVRLLRTLPDAEQVIAAGSPLPAFDIHAPLLSLPGIFDTRLDSIPAVVPYIGAPLNPALPTTELSVLQKAKRRIGIAWAGRETYRYNASRSCPLAQFTQLAEQLGMPLFSFQKGPRSLANGGVPDDFPIIDLSEKVDDFYDTATIIAQLDLVVTVDTSLAHLAGAMGHPVWVDRKSVV